MKICIFCTELFKLLYWKITEIGGSTLKYFRQKIGIFIIGLFLICGPLNVQASEAGYGVSPLLPDNQLGDVSYFNLFVRPGATQELSLQLTNQETEPKTLQIIPTTAITTQQGVIDYTAKTAELSRGPVISELISPAQTVELTAKETKIVSFTLSMPKKSFQGVLLGSFLIQEVGQLTSNEGINNLFVYQIGLMLRENKTLPKPDVSFAKLTLNNNQLTIQVQNKNGRLLEGTFKGVLTGTKESFTQEIQLAPNTTAQIQLPFGHLPKGGATLELSFTPSKEHHFSYHQNFFLHGKKDALKLTQLPLSWQYLLGAILILGGLLFALSIWWVRRKRVPSNR